MALAPVYELRTLGSASLRARDGDEPVPLEPKRFALLVYLASPRPGRLRARDDVVGTFWPDASQHHANNALRQSLHYLKRRLGEGVLAGGGRDMIGVAEGAIACDAAEFEDALDDGDREGALEIYRGEFLATFRTDGPRALQEWIESRRERLRRLAVAAAVDVARREEEFGALASASRWFARALEIAPYDETIVRSHLEVLLKQGDTAGVTAQYRRFAERLARDLDDTPEEETRRMGTKGTGTSRELEKDARNELEARTLPLPESKALLQALLANTRSGVVIIGPDLRVFAWNETMRRLWGLDPDEAIRKRLPELGIEIPAESPIRECAEGKRKLWEGAIVVEREPGRAIEIRGRCAPFVDENGDHLGGVLFVEELSASA